MNKKTLAALGAFVVLAIIAFVALRQPEKGDRASDHTRPLPPIAAADVTSIDLIKNGATTTLQRDGANYKLTAPVSYPADNAAAKAAFEGIGKMDLTDLVSQQPGKQAEFEVDDKSGVHIVVKHDAKVLADLIIGKSVGAGTMVRPNGTNDIWQASNISKFIFDKTPTDLRDKSIITFTPGDAEKIDISGKDGAKISLKKSGTKVGNEDKWDLVSSTVKIDKLDNSVANNLVSSLASWKANDFADGIALPQAGLDAPALTVTVGIKGNQSVSALFGSKKGDDTYVKKADAPQVFTVKKFNVDRVEKAPIEFRDKTLCDLAADDISEISVVSGDKSYTLVKSGSDWKATKPAKMEVDTSKVTPIAGAFKELKATSFAEDQSPKANGLAKPKAVVSVKGKGKAGCQFKIGDESSDKTNYFVTGGKGPDVYQAPKWALDRILVKPDDLKKTGGTTTAAAKPAKPAGKLSAKK
jgi:hypothetical protein